MLTIKQRIEPDMMYAVFGYAVTITQEDGTDKFICLWQTHQQAEEYAKTACRGKNWRIVPSQGRLRAAAAIIRRDGTIDMVAE